MIEIRWFNRQIIVKKDDITHFGRIEKVLQYRTVIKQVWTEETKAISFEWSEWQDVPTVTNN